MNLFVQNDLSSMSKGKSMSVVKERERAIITLKGITFHTFIQNLNLLEATHFKHSVVHQRSNRSHFVKNKKIKLEKQVQIAIISPFWKHR